LRAALIAGTVLPAGAVAAASAPLQTDHLRTQLVAQTLAAVPGQPLRIGLRLQHDPHWHSYWRNPGDSGLATRIELDLPEGVTAGPIEWPAPQRFDVEEIVNFGYSGTIVLPLSLQIPATLDAPRIEITARASWLVCEVECIPGRGEYRLNLELATETTPDGRWSADFDRALARQPRPLAGDATLRQIDDRILVELRSSNLPDDIAAWEVFPAQPQVVVNGAHPWWSRIEGGLRMGLPRSEYFAQLPERFGLLLVKGDQALAIDAVSTPATE
jgi:thiol:disulfide interchange protein DsbD